MSLEKLKIIAYEDGEYNTKGKTYEVLFNPQQIVENVDIKFDETKSSGSAEKEQKFKSIESGEFKLDLIFDATGVVDLFPKPVIKQIEDFKKVALYIKGKTHQPHFLQIEWGAFLMKVRLKSLTITYTLFTPEGSPIRAKANATFIRSIDDKLRVTKEGKSSPDLTHVRTVESGDTLPLMTYRIYGDSSYYLEVARVNRIRNFRKLKAGQKLFFPPVDKSVA